MSRNNNNNNHNQNNNHEHSGKLVLYAAPSSHHQQQPSNNNKKNQMPPGPSPQHNEQETTAWIIDPQQEEDSGSEEKQSLNPLRQEEEEEDLSSSSASSSSKPFASPTSDQQGSEGGDVILPLLADDSSAPKQQQREPSSPSREEEQDPVVPQQQQQHQQEHLQMELQWCNSDACKDTIRERVVSNNQGHNHIVLTSPATGQVAYTWHRAKQTLPSPSPSDLDDNNDPQQDPGRKGRRTRSMPSWMGSGKKARPSKKQRTTLLSATGASAATLTAQPQATQSVLLLIKQHDEELMQIAAQAVQAWISPPPPPPPDVNKKDNKDYHSTQNDDIGITVLLEPSVAARLEHYYGVQDDHHCIRLFESTPLAPSAANSLISAQHQHHQEWPDLICTLGGDGLLMHAGMLFQGPSPPILCVAGGSLGFLTPFQADEMVDAVRVALGLVSPEESRSSSSHHPMGDAGSGDPDLRVYPPNMPSYPYEPLVAKMPGAAGGATAPARPTSVPFGFGGDRMCLSIRMRLQCRILNRQGVCRAAFNVLNEVVVDRGHSPYLAALECFCDDSHLTTVQADGILFATPTGSTAYSMAAGGSVVHPAVPCILVTPICPHVLSFRSMIFPDSVVLQCVVPDDARAEASVALDGKHRQALHRGECVEISMSRFPVPTLNRLDHSSDWLDSLKRNFGFNARPRQRAWNANVANNHKGDPRNMANAGLDDDDDDDDDDDALDDDGYDGDAGLINPNDKHQEHDY